MVEWPLVPELSHNPETMWTPWGGGRWGDSSLKPRTTKVFLSKAHKSVLRRITGLISFEIYNKIMVQMPSPTFGTLSKSLPPHVLHKARHKARVTW